MRILIFGLTHSGKEALASELRISLNYAQFNEEYVRRHIVSYVGQKSPREDEIKQAKIMKAITVPITSTGSSVICDFVCPFKETRKIFDADYAIFMNTVELSQPNGIDEYFEYPSADEYDLKITDFRYSLESIKKAMFLKCF